MSLTLPVSPMVDPQVLAYAIQVFAPTGAVTFRVDDDSVTYFVDGSTIGTSRDPAEASDSQTVVRLSRQAWDDMAGQVRTFVNLLLSGDLAFGRGGFDELADWDPIFKYLHAGIPPYDPDRADFHGRDPAAVLSADTGETELAAQLRTMGFLHVAGVFGSDEMRAANREVDRLAGLARPGDDESWWVGTPDGSNHADGGDGAHALCRLVYTTLRSPLLAALEADPRVRRLGTLLDPTLRAAPDRMEGSAVLLKVPGNTTGLSNIPWHQDCGMGGHAVMCPAVSVGIQLTGSDSSTGNLLVVPGSHGQAMHYRWEDRLEQVPVVRVDTAPGDVTVHIGDLMHASPRPTGAGGRRTLYVSYYPPRLWRHVGPGQAYNDVVRNRTAQAAALQ